MSRMEQGYSGGVTIPVHAWSWLNDTGLDVTADDVVTFSVIGQWWDARFPAGAAGYDAPWWLRPWGRLLRCQAGRWLELAGAIGRDGNAIFAIGMRPRVTMPRSGRLYLFANDVSGFYWNNRGALDVCLAKDPRQGA